MGDPAEENDPPPESISFSQIRLAESTRKLKKTAKFFVTTLGRKMPDSNRVLTSVPQSEPPGINHESNE
jgi:hypothetical protein